jgi:hypothetical protein
MEQYRPLGRIGVSEMPAGKFEGFVIPTYFANKVLAAEELGPNVKFYLGAGRAQVPECSVIWPYESIPEVIRLLEDLLEASGRGEVVPMRVTP